MSQLPGEGYRRLLENKRAELAAGLKKRDGIAIERSADLMEELQCAAEREIAIAKLDRVSNLLRAVDDALLRIHGGEYGLCLECGERIGPKRLAAVPWTPLCLPCQDAADHAARQHAA